MTYLLTYLYMSLSFISISKMLFACLETKLQISNPPSPKESMAV